MASTASDMDDPTTYNHKFFEAKSAEVKLHYVDEGEGTEKVVVFLHGWPDIWYGWHKQIRPVAKAGYRVIAPDLPGMGQTKADPKKLSLFTHKVVSGVINELLESLGIKKFILLGHDWGGELAWKYSIMHSDRVTAVGAFVTPYWPRPEKCMTLDILVARSPAFKYQQYFNTEEAVKELDADIDKLIRFAYRSHKTDNLLKEGVWMADGLMRAAKDVKPSDILTEQETAYYVSQFKQSGMRGSLNWYRTLELNWADLEGFPVEIKRPTLMVTAENDPVCSPALTIGMEKIMPNLTRVAVEKCGHFILAEKHEEATKAILDWLKKISC